MLKRFADWLRAQRNMPLALIAGIATIAIVGWLSFDVPIDELVGKALGPLMLSPDTTDDGAGDTLTAAAEAERYLPLPSALEDERVVAAIGPIANLSCKRSDYAPEDAGPSTGPPSDLGPPLTETDASEWIDRSAATAALAPLTERLEAARDNPEENAASKSEARERALAAPLAPSESDMNSLYTRNLMGAALSPIAALHAPTPATPQAAVALAPVPADCPQLLHYTFNRLQTGEPQTLCQFQGKVLLIVNTASYCGYTKQYEGLEAMYRKYKDRGLVVVGFPSNDFGRQEPGSNGEIAEFCRTTYGVQFPMFEKSSVAKLDANPLYVELATKTGVAPRWNFHKYVVDRSGTRITSFASDVTPNARNLVDLIERLLAEQPAAGKV